MEAEQTLNKNLIKIPTLYITQINKGAFDSAWLPLPALSDAP